MPVALSAPHWLPVRSTKKIPSMAARSGTRGLWQPSGWLGRGGSSGAIRSHKASGIRQPLSWIIWPIDLLQTGTILKEQQPGRQILPTGIGSYLATASLAAIGTASFIWPFIDSMNPSADVLALASIDVNLSPVAVGQAITVSWRGKPVFIRHRTPEEIEAA